MGNIYTGTHKDDENEAASFYSSINSNKLTNQDAVNILKPRPLNLVKSLKQRRTLFLNFVQPESRVYFLHELFLKHHPSKGVMIPKHLVTLDEKYLKQCLEQIHMNASEGDPCALSINSSSINFEIMSDYVKDEGINSLDETKYANDYPVEVESEDFVTNSVDEEIVGSIMGSDSMMNILSSPLFKRLGISANDTRLKGTSLFKNKSCVLSDYPDSARHSISSSSEKEPLVNRGPDFLSDSTGMLRCMWKDGVPYFTFSLDDQKELYVANAWKVDLVKDDKSLDYVYSFHIKPYDQKMNSVCDNWSDLIGKMKVSTSISPCSDNSKIMKTEFVLVIPDKIHPREMHTPSQNGRQTRKLSKVIEVLKSGHSSKHQTHNVIKETNNLNNYCIMPYLSESDFQPNFEVAAIIVEDRLQPRDCEKGEGWGLKFLKSGRVKQKGANTNGCKSSECGSHNARNWSTSMDIIVPVGTHGGPRTRDGGPASLVERWRSGGGCDCGGWDVGCPLKVLKVKPRKEEKSSCEARFKSFDLFTEGSKQETPLVKIASVHDNLYFINFNSSSLSPLQCFSIAVAILHSQSPTLRPDRVHD